MAVRELVSPRDMDVEGCVRDVYRYDGSRVGDPGRMSTEVIDTLSP